MSSISASSRMCSMSWFLPTSMWTSVWCRPLRLSLIHILFELIYFQKHAPKEVLEHWNILVGRQPVQNIGLRTNDGWEISGDDVQIWLEEQGANSFAISAYCEKLLPKLQEEEGRAWWMLTTRCV